MRFYIKLRKFNVKVPAKILKVFAAAGYRKLFKDFKLAHMIKTHKSVSFHQDLKIREPYICYIV